MKYIINILQETARQHEVIWKVVLSEVSKLNDLWAVKIGVKIIGNSREKLASFLKKKYDFYCFCCCNPALSHRMIDHFMNELIDGILRF